MSTIISTATAAAAHTVATPVSRLMARAAVSSAATARPLTMIGREPPRCAETIAVTVSPSRTSSSRDPDGASRAATARPPSGSPRAASRASSRAASAQRIVCATAVSAPNANARNIVSAHSASAASTVTAPASAARGGRRVAAAAGIAHRCAAEPGALPVIRKPPAVRVAPDR